MTEANDNNPESKLDATVLRFIEAQMRGDAPDIEEFVGQYPDLEQEIRQKIASLGMVDSLFDSLRLADASDFPTQEVSRDLVGTQVGNFKVVQVIGRGGMGVVYKGQDSRLDRVVAVKAMPAHLLRDSTAEARFRREAKLLASLSHPNVAVIYDIVEQDRGGTYLILEYVPGETLAERLARGPLGLKETLALSRQIAEAVSAAHDKGVIHRDLKPSNIKITPEGRVKVLDFGLAKTARDETADRDNTVTQAGRVIGTPAYMSPEQARGRRIDQRTDIWSFGCVMYEMLTGHLPFEGETSTDIIARILEREPNWQALPQETPENIRALLRRCLEKDTSHRLQHIGDAALEISETRSVPAGARPVVIPAEPRKSAMLIGAVVVIVLSAVAVRFIPRLQTPSPTKDIRLVILPFENPGPDDDEYFADSITDQITSHLTSVRGLSILSPRTAGQYEKGKKTAPQIGEELGVDYILEGVVQRERPSDPTSQMKVMPRLIRASEDRLVLAPIYPMQAEDLNELFRVQADLAGQVAQVLGVTPLEQEPRALKAKPTESTEAYRYYLRGNDYFHRSYEEEDFRIAIQMYDKAAELDPTFALAHARLSMAHSWMYWFHDRNNEARLTAAKQAVDKALQLNPDLPEAHSALGRCYYNHLDFDRALEQFAIARKSRPNDSEIMSLVAYAQRRQGKFVQALANIKRACELDPLSSTTNLQVGVTHMLLHRYAEAEHYYERAISLSPDLAFAYFWKAGLYLQWQGSTEKAWAVVEQLEEDTGPSEDAWIVFRSVVLHVLEGKYAEALDRLSSYKSEAFDNQFYFVPKAQLSGQITGLMGNQQLEQAHYESARSMLEARIQQQPEDERFHSALGIAYAGLGRGQEAIREGQLGVELLPVTEDAWRGLYRLEDLARIYTMVSEYDAAVEQIEYLLSIPGEISVPLLRLDPIWDPLRDHPRFKTLVRAGG